jgi:hypothetical protein
MKDRRHGKHAQRNQDCDLQIYPLRLPTPRYQSKSRVARRRESELREFGSGASPSPKRFFRRVILARMRRPKIFDFEPVPQLFDLVVRIQHMPKSGFRWCRLRGLNSRPSVYKTARHSIISTRYANRVAVVLRASLSQQTKLNIFRSFLVRGIVCKPVPVPVISQRDRRVAHQSLNSLRIRSVLYP